MTNSPYIVVTVKCPHCDMEQGVDVHNRSKNPGAPPVPGYVICRVCGKSFDVMLPDEIFAGGWV